MAGKKRAQASQRVREEWSRRVEAEYRSAAITQHFSLWLIQLGAPPSLIEDGLRVVRDELAHARLSHAVFRAAGGEAVPPIDRASLELARTEPALERDVLRIALETYCLGETVAVRLFAAMRDGATEPSAKRALDRILRDEVRHRDFGFDVLDVLLELDPSLAALAQSLLPEMLARLHESYAGGTLEEEKTLPREDRAYGLIPGAMYVSAVAATIRKDYVPRFGKRGITL
jgi:hypothetical protein